MSLIPCSSGLHTLDRESVQKLTSKENRKLFQLKLFFTIPKYVPEIRKEKTCYARGKLKYALGSEKNIIYMLQTIHKDLQNISVISRYVCIYICFSRVSRSSVMKMHQRKKKPFKVPSTDVSNVSQEMGEKTWMGKTFVKQQLSIMFHAPLTIFIIFNDSFSI